MGCPRAIIISAVQPLIVCDILYIGKGIRLTHQQYKRKDLRSGNSLYYPWQIEIHAMHEGIVGTQIVETIDIDIKKQKPEDNKTYK